MKTVKIIGSLLFLVFHIPNFCQAQTSLPAASPKNKFQERSGFTPRQAIPESIKKTSTVYVPGYYLYLRWNTALQAWDSTEKHFLTHDWTGAILTDSVLAWTGPPGNWSNSKKTINTYDSQGNLILKDSKTWISNTWANDRREIWNFNNLYHNTLNVVILWNAVSSNWDTSSGKINTYTYDADNNITQKIAQVWSSGNSWQNQFKFDYSFDLNGNQDTSLISAWSSGWLYQSKTINFFNASNELDSNLVQRWISNAWLNNNRNVNYSWHDYPGNEANTYETQIWSGSSWDNYYKYNTSYGLNHSNVMILQQWFGGSWQDKSRTTINNDANGNKILYLYEPTTGLGTFITYSGDSSTITYDVNGNILTRDFLSYNNTTLNFVKVDRYEYGNYNVDREPELTPADFTLWPNPASTDIFVKCSDAKPGSIFTLTDIQGKRLRNFEWMGTGTQQFSLEGLQAGVYFLQQSGNSMIKKIVHW